MGNTVQMARGQQVDLLRSFLRNPGRFSIFLLGETGVGKSHWLRKIQQEICAETPCAAGIVEIHLEFAEPSKAYWEERFKEADGKIMLIKDIELAGQNAPFIFEALSTQDGKVGIVEKKYEVRPVFTSTLDISQFRKNKDLLPPRLFDRISQLVVRLPSLHETEREIWNDFEATWTNMRFEAKNDMPAAPLKTWLEGHPGQLHGNFRDLQKLAILWHQFRLMGIAEDRILSQVREIFLEQSSFPEQFTKLEEGVFFQHGKTYDELLKSFRLAVKSWAKKEEQGNLKAAAAKLGINVRTFERW